MLLTPSHRRIKSQVAGPGSYSWESSEPRSDSSNFTLVTPIPKTTPPVSPLDAVPIWCQPPIGPQGISLPISAQRGFLTEPCVSISHTSQSCISVTTFCHQRIALVPLFTKCLSLNHFTFLRICVYFRNRKSVLVGINRRKIIKINVM